MYRTSTIWNLFNSLRAFFSKWLKWRSYSPFAKCYFVNWPHLTDEGSFARNSNFENKLRLYTFNIQCMYENVNFSFLLWNKLYLYFVTFLLRASICSCKMVECCLQSVIFHLLVNGENQSMLTCFLASVLYAVHEWVAKCSTTYHYQNSSLKTVM